MKRIIIIGAIAIAMAVRGTSVEIIMPMLSALSATITIVARKMKNLSGRGCRPVIQYTMLPIMSGKATCRMSSTTCLEAKYDDTWYMPTRRSLSTTFFSAGKILRAENMAPKPWLTITKNSRPRRLKTEVWPLPMRRYINPISTPRNTFCTRRNPYVVLSRKALRAARVQRIRNWFIQLANACLLDRSTSPTFCGARAASAYLLELYSVRSFSTRSPDSRWFSSLRRSSAVKSKKKSAGFDSSGGGKP
eukprot:Mycagemm_TRINITY_DN10278_c2_g2::TRINITY_DN10278_c2_g2_i1::g.3643::m.3643 type:complete len:248 gc:universal TRINITY_DN10278_c2_g2_i1:301-1044(+)